MDKIKLTMEECKYIIALLIKCSSIVDAVPDKYKAITYKEFYKHCNDGLTQKEAESLIMQTVGETIQLEEEFNDFLTIISAKFVYAKESMIKEGQHDMVLELLNDLEQK